MASEPAARLAALPSIISIPGRAIGLAPARIPVPHTPLVGRQRELGTLRALLLRDEVRLLTLIGPGGAGKTRLAISLAESLEEQFADGVVYVGLANVREPTLAMPAIYQALGGRDAGSDFNRERLLQLFVDRDLLLILDNFEQLVDAAAALCDMLDASSQLKIVVTSRSALRLSGEHQFLVPPLALPDLAPGMPAEAIMEADAVRFFVQRATAARPDFAPNSQDLAAIAVMCHRLDGLPLALELAAARVSHLSPEDLARRLNAPGAAGLPLLTGGMRDQPARHQTMRETIAWSFDLLSDRERGLFCALSVFAGGFTAAAARAVCELNEIEVLDGIGALVAGSLVRYLGDEDGQPRYGLYQTIREFGLEQLGTAGEEAAARECHAAWVLDQAERAAPHLQGPSAAPWLHLLERDHANLRAALAWWAGQGNGPSLSRLAAALAPFWEEHAHFAEGRRWLELALDLGQEAPAEVRLQLLAGAGTMARHQADFAQGIAHHEQALALSRELGDRAEEATILHLLGAQATDLGDFAQARGRFEACIAVAREANAPRPLIRALHSLGQIERVELNSEGALQSLEEVLGLVRAHQMSWVVPYLINGIALASTDLGDHERAIALFHENIAASATLGNFGHVVDAIEGLARVAAATGQEATAARLFGAAEAQREAMTFPISPTEIAYAEPVMGRLREALGERGFAEAWASGRLLTRGQAIEKALAVRAGPASDAERATWRRATAHGLTRREAEVLRLLAAGYSNRELGETLFISPATAARHVANIYSKLGVDSRAKAAAYAHQHGLI